MMHKRCKTCDALMRPYAPEDWDECGSCRDESRMDDLKDQLKTERARVRVLREALDAIAESEWDASAGLLRDIANKALTTTEDAK